MLGVTILNSHDILEPSWLSAICAAIIPLICIIIGMIKFSITKDSFYAIVTGFVCIITGLICSQAISDFKLFYEPTGEKKYEIIINDEVKYNDFVLKYEIINEDNGIYTVKERY